MNRTVRKYVLMTGAATAMWLFNGQSSPTGFDLVAAAEAVVGAPATPVSYAGVARRTTVRAVTPGVGAPGVGVAPGVNTPTNVGGPVNRVGVR